MLEHTPRKLTSLDILPAYSLRRTAAKEVLPLIQAGKRREGTHKRGVFKSE